MTSPDRLIAALALAEPAYREAVSDALAPLDAISLLKIIHKMSHEEFMVLQAEFRPMSRVTPWAWMPVQGSTCEKVLVRCLVLTGEVVARISYDLTRERINIWTPHFKGFCRLEDEIVKAKDAREVQRRWDKAVARAEDKLAIAGFRLD